MLPTLVSRTGTELPPVWRAPSPEVAVWSPTGPRGGGSDGQTPSAVGSSLIVRTSVNYGLRQSPVRVTSPDVQSARFFDASVDDPEVRIAIVIWIERTYHRRRRQRALGRLTPIEYETVLSSAAHAA